MKCLIHNSNLKKKEFIHSLLQVLRTACITTKNDHNFIKICICMCGKKKNEFLKSDLNYDDFLKWFQSNDFRNLSDEQSTKDKAFYKIKEQISNISFIENVEMQGFLLLLGIFKCIYEEKLKNDILKSFFRTTVGPINFNEQEGFNLKFQLETFIGQFVGKGRCNLKAIEEEFKSHIKLIRQKNKIIAQRNRINFFEKSKITLKICSLKFYELEQIKEKLVMLHRKTVYSVNKSKQLREERLRSRKIASAEYYRAKFLEEKSKVYDFKNLKEINEDKYSKSTKKTNRSSKTIKTVKVKENLNVCIGNKHYKIKALKKYGKNFSYKLSEFLNDLF